MRYVVESMSEETILEGKTSVGQGCEMDDSTLKPISLASVKINDWKLSVDQGVIVPSAS